MKRWLPLLLLFLLFPLSAHAAAAPPLGPSFYPAGMKITTRPHLSNNHYLCWWSYDCSSGSALFHTATPTDAHRISGWLETATMKHLSFVLLDSLFPTPDDAAASLTDLADTTVLAGFAPAIPKGGVPATTGTALFTRIALGKETLTVYAVAVGTHLIEGAEWHQSKTLAPYKITAYLLKQVTGAINLDQAAS